ncbi:hypothetical protein FQZ97_1250420 [compost metagenome]
MEPKEERRGAGVFIGIDLSQLFRVLGKRITAPGRPVKTYSFFISPVVIQGGPVGSGGIFHPGFRSEMMPFTHHMMQSEGRSVIYINLP